MRGPTPKKTFTNSTYRKAIDPLLTAFENRCAYSMQHMDRAGGRKCMEVDHFKPKGRKRNAYTNLLPATRHCNGAKGQNWPTKAQSRQGLRLLNPCREVDYGVHLFEDPATHEVVGKTPAGKWHIRVCDLNAPHLVRERKDRAKIDEVLRRTPGLLSGPPGAATEAIRKLREQCDLMIPHIEAP